MNNEELILQMLGKISDKLEEHDKHFESIDNRFESIDNRFESLETDVRHTRMLIEKQEHNVQLIAEQYGDISAKLERVREIDELRDRVRTLETVVRNHTVSIKELRKAESKHKADSVKAARSFYAVFPPAASCFCVRYVHTGKASGAQRQLFQTRFPDRLKRASRAFHRADETGQCRTHGGRM